MTRVRVLSAALLLLVGSAVLYAQELRILENILVLDRFQLGAGVALEMEGTTNDAFEMTFRHDMTADGHYIFPATVGSAGTQLQTDGVATATQLSWASAGSLAAYKTLEGVMDPQAALRAVVETPVYQFHYKPEAGEHTTHDYATQYVGVI